MNEPQVWTMIGVFSAAIFAMFGIVSGLFTQVVRAEIGKVMVVVEGIDHRLERVETRLDRVETRLDRVETKLDNVDRDVQAISRRVFPDPS